MMKRVNSKLEHGHTDTQKVPENDDQRMNPEHHCSARQGLGT